MNTSQPAQPEINALKHIAQLECPDCKTTLYASVVFITPQITEVITSKVMKTVIKDLKKRIGEMDIDEEVKNKALGELDTEGVIVFKEDVEGIVKSVLAAVHQKTQEVQTKESK